MAEYRLDELSALSGVSVRNIRAYRERGLLDPPRRQGRAALYDERHLSQLATVNELLRKGFTSAHIAEFLDSTRQGHDLADILGLQQAIFGEPRVAVAIDADGDEARRLVAHGLAEVVDGRVTLTNPHLAELLDRVADQLPYVQAILEVADRVTGLLDELAGVVADALEDSLPAAAPAQGPVAGPASERLQVIDDYGLLGRRVVAERFGAALRRRLMTASADSGSVELDPACEATGS
ncbi:hypothetical protein MMAD_38690 [Mycolicibacterium madagascariense]|uniref:HTH merR-type domain-containing protein n=1 Tax=Mycolicibacterium madagascariense TaxID=212765 RepID=A0A7I7XK41_9MYCO|nr:MerR family transcriptional regulator [Mycolicibacterium madagascariense]MCV7011222.1 MerR family transcriptional regulator [Mycolicibacterium madagascariense]BBZ29574.1 hypothetical protein MMAD_38690 [Mycolicibacterium madagascariense]